MEKHPSFTNLIGIPYRERNCWQLARDFYKQVLGKELKHYFDDLPSDRTELKNLIFSNVGDFVKVDKPKFGDLIIIKIFGYESHIAIFVGNGRMLHATEKSGSVIDRIERFSKLIVGYYTLDEGTK